MSFVDPVASPDAYQRMLLDLLGADDPARVQDATPPTLHQLVAEAGPDLRS